MCPQVQVKDGRIDGLPAHRHRVWRLCPSFHGVGGWEIGTAASREVRDEKGIWERSPQFQGRVGGNQRNPTSSYPCQYKQTSPSPTPWCPEGFVPSGTGSGGAAPSSKGGWAGNKGTCPTNPTPPEKTLGHTGGLGIAPVFQRGGQVATKNQTSLDLVRTSVLYSPHARSQQHTHPRQRPPHAPGAPSQSRPNPLQFPPVPIPGPLRDPPKRPQSHIRNEKK